MLPDSMELHCWYMIHDTSGITEVSDTVDTSRYTDSPEPYRYHKNLN